MSVWGLIGGSAKVSVYCSLEFMVCFSLSSLCLYGPRSRLNSVQRERERTGEGARVACACVCVCVQRWVVFTGYGPFLPTLITVTLKGEHPQREMFIEQEDRLIMETFFSSTLSLIIFLKGSLKDNHN